MYMSDADLERVDVRVRLKGEDSTSFRMYAESLGLPLATCVRMLALESLNIRLEARAREVGEKRTNLKSFQQQVGNQ